MAMPDKIRIIGIERNKNGAFGRWTTRPFNGEVYIRKEALLEWAKEQKEDEMANFPYILDMLIDKLNSM